LPPHAAPFSVRKTEQEWKPDSIKKRKFLEADAKKLPKFEFTTENCLVSEKFDKVIDTDVSGHYIISVSNNKDKPVIYMLNDGLVPNSEILWLSDAENPAYCAIRMKNKRKWAIIRIKDGTRICELKDVSLVENQAPMCK
jgi:hypothetical protein